MANQASIKFYLFEGPTPGGVLPIYMRITYNRKKAELHTGFTCTKKKWNSTNQNTRNSTTVNRKLSDKKAAVYSFLEDLEKENKPVSAAILKDLLTGKTRVKTRLLEYLENYIEETVTRGQIKTISVNKYRQSLSSQKALSPKNTRCLT